MDGSRRDAMKILVSRKFERELLLILEQMQQQLGCKDTKNFKLYLDTILLNIPTKLHKYKTSPYFGDAAVKEVDYNGFKIFIYENKKDKYIILLSMA